MDQQQQQDQQDQSPIQMALQDYKEGIGVFTKKNAYDSEEIQCFYRGVL